MLYAMLPLVATAPQTVAQWRGRGFTRAIPCDHLHDTTTRFDPEAKLLSFLLVCPVCRTERVVETQRYEPRFIPRAVTRPQLPLREAA
jgi:hypothetical protein